jgi:hypothetical protein
MAWKIMKRYVTVAGIFGASKWTNPKPASVAPIAEWVSRSLSNTEIPNAFLGKVNLIRKRLPAQFTKTNQFYPGYEIAGIRIASIQNISKKLDLR